MAVQDTFTNDLKVEEKDLYHQIVKEHIESEYDVSITYKIIFQERFKYMLENIFRYCNENPVDHIFFHIRTNHYLRLLEPLGRIHPKYKKGLFKFNLPAITKGKLPLDNYQSPEDDLSNEVTSLTTRSHFINAYKKLNLKFLWRKTRFLRLLTGILCGNMLFVDAFYFRLVEELIAFSKHKTIPVTFIGIVSRPISRTENFLSYRLNKKFIHLLQQRKLTYLNIFGTHNPSGSFLFKSDRIHVNEYVHASIAEKIEAELKTSFKDQNKKDVKGEPTYSLQA